MTAAPPLSRVSHPADSSAHAPNSRPFVRTRSTWFAYGMLGFFAFLQAVLGPLMPFLRATLHISYAVASLHFSAFALGATITGIVGDRFVRRWGRAGAIWCGAGGMVGGVLCVASSLSVVVTILGALLLGLFGVLLLNALQATLMEQHQPSGAVALAEANVFASFFAILASATVGALAGLGLTWRGAFLPALLVLAVLVLCRQSPAEHARRHTSTEQPSGSRASGRLPLHYWVLWGTIVLETAVEWIFAYWGTSLLAARGILTPGAAATAMSAFFLAMLLARYAGSRLLRVVPGRVVVIASLGIALVGFPFFWLATLPLLKVVGLFCVGLGLANVYPVGVGLASGEVPARTDLAMARISIGTGLAVLIAPLALGTLADAIGITGAFGIALPLLVGSLVCAMLAGKLPSRHWVAHRVAPQA